MDERNMIIGLVLVLLVIGAYYIFAQDNGISCTSDADCGNCQYCYIDPYYGSYCTAINCMETSCPECCTCNDGFCFGYCTNDSHCPSGCECVNNGCQKEEVPYVIPPGPEKPRCKDVNVTVDVDCDENTVTVKDKKTKDELKDIRVKVVKYGSTIYTGSTNRIGEFYFNETDGSVDIYTLKYEARGKCYLASGKISVTLNTTAECKPECTKDADCASGYECKDNKCVAKPPPPKPAPKPECTKDADCSSDKYCSNEKCVPVTGTCGYAANHTWVKYECCVDEDCSEGYECKEHKCVEIIYDLSGKGGAVGSKGTVTAYTDNTVLANTQLRVTKPDGSYVFMTTDSNGRITLPFTQAGTYTVGIYVNGTLMKSLTVVSTAKAPVTPSRPTIFDVLAQNTPLLLVLLVIVVLAYWMFLRKPPRVRKKPGRLK